MSDEPDSPCVHLCILDEATGYCLGCGRTSAEIGAWLFATAEEKRAILAQLPARLEGIEARERAREEQR